MGGVRPSKRSKSSQLGFTLVELMVAIAIGAVMLVGIGAALRAILVSSANSSNEALARSEVQKVDSWIGDDVVQAQAIELGDIAVVRYPTPFLYLSWNTWPYGGFQTVTYSVGNMTDKLNRPLWRLYRTAYSGTSGTTGTTVVAEYLKPFDPTNPLSTTSCYQLVVDNGTLENVLVMNVASQVDAYSASGSYEISPRAGNVTWNGTNLSLTYIAGANGYLTGNTLQTVNYGGNGTTVTAVPNNSNYLFATWSDGLTTASRTDTNVRRNILVTANFASYTNTITASASSGGSITPSGAVVVNYGGNRTFTITANSGYCTNVVVDGDSVGNVTSYQFTNVTDDHTIAAMFFQPTITASAGAGGSISPSGNVSVSCGGNQAFTITPNAHYNVADVLVDGASVGNVTSYTFPNVTGDHTIAASFAIYTYTITASAGLNGSITPSGAVVVNYGGNQTFTISANTGYHIGNVTVDGVSKGAIGNYTFGNITAAHSIAASFAINTYTVTPSAGTGGSLTPSTPQTVNYGNTTSFTVTANTHYHIASVTGCGGTLSGTTYTTGPITGNCTVAATFAIDTYTVTPSAGTGGSLTPSTPQTVNYGNTTSFTVTANSGYSIASVTGCGGTLVGTIYTTGAITGNCTVTATFAINTYTVTPSAGTGGSLNPSTPQTVNYGNTTSFTVTPNSHYHIASVTGCGGTLVGNTYTTGPITGSCTVTATFAIDTYTLTYTAGANGSILGSSPQTVNYGGNGTTVKAVPNSGYCFVNWSDGVTTASRTDSNVTGNISVTANFAQHSTGSMAPTADSPSSGAFTNPGNAFGCSQYAYATASGTQESYYNFNFSGVTGTIVGIQVTFNAYASKTNKSPRAFNVDLSGNGGGNFSSVETTGDLTSTSSTSPQNISLGGTSDTWGGTWSAGNFTNANFRVRITASLNGMNLYLDCVRVIVYYCP